jgi:hypothetical protein
MRWYNLFTDLDPYLWGAIMLVIAACAVLIHAVLRNTKEPEPKDTEPEDKPISAEALVYWAKTLLYHLKGMDNPSNTGNWGSKTQCIHHAQQLLHELRACTQPKAVAPDHRTGPSLRIDDFESHTYQRAQAHEDRG